jgi:hypothetical protein
VQLLCGEFGSEGDHGASIGATSESRAAYLKTVRTALEAAGIAWMMHELNSTSDGFRIASDKAPFDFDPTMANALRLAQDFNSFAKHHTVP